MVEISDVSKENLRTALKLELDNTAFYLCAMNNAKKVGDEYEYAKFKARDSFPSFNPYLLMPSLDSVRWCAKFHRRLPEFLP